MYKRTKCQKSKLKSKLKKAPGEFLSPGNGGISLTDFQIFSGSLSFAAPMYKTMRRACRHR